MFSTCSELTPRAPIADGMQDGTNYATLYKTHHETGVVDESDRPKAATGGEQWVCRLHAWQLTDPKRMDL